MNLIALTVLVAFVSSDLLCTRSEYEEQSFREIPEKEFQDLIKRSERKINDSDCTQSYKVQMKNGKNPLYVFAIERQNFSRIYGIINEDEKNKHRWHESDEDEFKFFLNSCRNTGTMPAKALENFRGVLSCNKSPQATQSLNRTLRVSSTTPRSALGKLKSILKKKN